MVRLPNLRVENLGGSLRILQVNNTDLARDKRFTFLSEDIVSGGSTIRVQSLLGFESLTTASGQVVCIGEVGSEKSEILRTSQTTAPAGVAKPEVTLRDTLGFDHPQDTKVYILDWNRAEFQYATTVTGTKVTLAAYPIAIQPDQRETLHRDILEMNNRLGQGTAFYFARFNDSINSRNSDWSDAVPSGQYADNTVFMLKKRALDSVGEKVDGEIITHEFLDESLWEARREYHQALGKRPFRRKFNVDIGDALTGSFRIVLPDDVERPHTSENVYGVRIGSQANMGYYDKKEWDFDWRNKPRTTLAHPYTYATSTSLWLANGRDFGASAVVSVEGVNISVTRIAGLTGESFYNSLRIYSHPTGGWSASAGSDAYENVSYGLPDKFTVWADPGGSAYIYFNRPIETAYVNQNIYLDYYRTVVDKDSDADVLDEPNPDIFTPYLAWKIKQKKARGTLRAETDPDYREWVVKKNASLNAEHLGTNIRITPDIEHLP
ncbi:MAG: hypothetical protein AAB721_01535 [Patescibacteria group bacterium]